MTQIKIHLLPDGKYPRRMTEGAVGYDVSIRSIVCPFDKDKDNKILRKTLFDFKHMPDDPSARKHIVEVDGELVYRMNHGESVLVGIGFITEMEFPMFYWVAPRSGLAAKYGITVTNAPGTVDPDYRGEAGVLVYNRDNPTFDLRQNMRIAQIIFQEALIPDFIEVDTHEELIESKRGSGGFGSTDII